MANAIVITHGALGEALIRAAEMIAGPQEGLYALPLLPGESPEMLQGRLSPLLEQMAGQETLVLIDLLGGTPYNVAVRRMLQDRHIAGVTGVNLPMLLEFVALRADGSAQELAGSLTWAGQESIRDVGPMLRKQIAPGEQRSAAR